jgi:hypothetical protein
VGSRVTGAIGRSAGTAVATATRQAASPRAQALAITRCLIVVGPVSVVSGKGPPPGEGRRPVSVVLFA